MEMIFHGELLILTRGNLQFRSIIITFMITTHAPFKLVQTALLRGGNTLTTLGGQAIAQNQSAVPQKKRDEEHDGSADGHDRGQVGVRLGQGETQEHDGDAGVLHSRFHADGDHLLKENQTWRIINQSISKTVNQSIDQSIKWCNYRALLYLFLRTFRNERESGAENVTAPGNDQTGEHCAPRHDVEHVEVGVDAKGEDKEHHEDGEGTDEATGDVSPVRTITTNDHADGEGSDQRDEGRKNAGEGNANFHRPEKRAAECEEPEWHHACNQSNNQSIKR